MTKAKVAALAARKDRASQRVFASAPDKAMTFGGCLDAAPEAVRAAYLAAERALDEARAAAVASGKAYRGSFGTVLWHR